MKKQRLAATAPGGEIPLKRQRTAQGRPGQTLGRSIGEPRAKLELDLSGYARFGL